MYNTKSFKEQKRICQLQVGKPANSQPGQLAFVSEFKVSFRNNMSAIPRGTDQIGLLRTVDSGC